MEPVDLDVVPGVHDDGGELTGERPVDPAEKLPGPNSTSQRDDLHRGIA